MGRVKKYKKIKAIDPFAKRGGKNDGDTTHDEPPDVFEEKRRTAAKRKATKSWDNEEDREQMIQQEAWRDLKTQKREKGNHYEKTIEGKRNDESMKEFKDRVRTETRITLRDELSALSKTSIKRKRRLKERKQQRKPGYKKEEKPDDMDFNQSETGHLRESDKGGSTEFAQAEEVKFGDRSDRPPELKTFNKKLPKKNLIIENKNNDNNNNNNNIEFNSDNSIAMEKILKKKTKIENICDADDSKGRTVISSTKEGNNTGKATASEMDALRLKAQEAYKQLKMKKLKEQNKSFF